MPDALSETERRIAAALMPLIGVQRLALLALFDAVAEMLDPDSDEFRMRFMRHLHSRRPSGDPLAAKLLEQFAAQIESEASPPQTGGRPQ